MFDGKPGALHDAINNEEFKGSWKDKFN